MQEGVIPRFTSRQRGNQSGSPSRAYFSHSITVKELGDADAIVTCLFFIS